MEALDHKRSDARTIDLAMPIRARRRARFDWFLIVLLILPGFLILPNLGASILWQDEAETATLGRRIVRYGYPLADDGRLPHDKWGHSIYAITDQGVRPDGSYIDINEDGVWIWTSWFANYLSAASFLVFDALGLNQGLEWSTFAARLPFALAGWLVLLVMYWGLLDITRDRTLSRVTIVLLMFSVPYLLFARQCRAYTLLAFYNFLQLWGYIRLTRGQRGSLSMFVVGGVGGYYSFFPAMVGLTAALGTHLILRHRRARLFGRFVLSCVAIAILTTPFFVYTRSWDRNYEGSGIPIAESAARFGASLRAYLVHVHESGWPFFLMLPILLAAVVRRRAWSRVLPMAGALLILASYVAMVAPASRTSFDGLIAIGGLVAGWVVIWIWRSSRKGRGKQADWRTDWIQVVALAMVFMVFTAAALANHPFFRYLMGAMPLFALATAWCVLRISARRLVAIIPMLVILIGCELFQFGPIYAARRFVLDSAFAQRKAQLMEDESLTEDEAHGRTFVEFNEYGHAGANGYAWTMFYKDGRWDNEDNRKELEFPIYNYAYELTHDYRGPIEAVIHYLLENAEPDDTVVTLYEHFPLKFYTNMRVLRTWELVDRGWNEYPDWVIAQHAQYKKVNLPPRIFRKLKERVWYERVELPGSPRALQWDNIPEPAWHFFRTLTPEDRPGRQNELLMFRLKPEAKTRSKTKRADFGRAVPSVP